MSANCTSDESESEWSSNSSDAALYEPEESTAETVAGEDGSFGGPNLPSDDASLSPLQDLAGQADRPNPVPILRIRPSRRRPAPAWHRDYVFEDESEAADRRVHCVTFSF